MKRLIVAGMTLAAGLALLCRGQFVTVPTGAHSGDPFPWTNPPTAMASSWSNYMGLMAINYNFARAAEALASMSNAASWSTNSIFTLSNSLQVLSNYVNSSSNGLYAQSPFGQHGITTNYTAGGITLTFTNGVLSKVQ